MIRIAISVILMILWSNAEVYYPGCTYRDLVLPAHPECAPKLIQGLADWGTDGDLAKNMFLHVAEYGLAVLSSFGPTQNGISMACNQILDIAFGGENPITQDDLSEQYNELMVCVDAKISDETAGIYKNLWKDQYNYFIEIIADKDLDALKTLQNQLTTAYSIWQDPTYYSDYLRVVAMLPVYSIAINTLYMTSTTYMGYLLADNECSDYQEAYAALQQALDIYSHWIQIAYDVFNAHYEPTKIHQRMWLYDLLTEDLTMHIHCIQSDDNAWDETALFTQWRSEFEDFRYSVIGELYEYTADMIEALDEITNICGQEIKSYSIKSILAQKYLTVQDEAVTLVKPSYLGAAQQFYISQRAIIHTSNINTNVIDRILQIKNANGKCLQTTEFMPDGSTYTKKGVEMMDCTNEEVNQQWTKFQINPDVYMFTTYDGCTICGTIATEIKGEKYEVQIGNYHSRRSWFVKLKLSWVISEFEPTPELTTEPTQRPSTAPFICQEILQFSGGSVSGSSSFLNDLEWIKIMDEDEEGGYYFMSTTDDYYMRFVSECKDTNWWLIIDAADSFNHDEMKPICDVAVGRCKRSQISQCDGRWAFREYIGRGHDIDTNVILSMETKC